MCSQSSHFEKVLVCVYVCVCVCVCVCLSEFVGSEVGQMTQRFVSAMLQEVELSVQPDRLLANTKQLLQVPFWSAQLCVCVCVCMCVCVCVSQ